MKTTKTVTQKIEVDGQYGRYKVLAFVVNGCVTSASVTDVDEDPDYFHPKQPPRLSFRSRKDLLNLKEALEELDATLFESSSQW